MLLNRKKLFSSLNGPLCAYLVLVVLNWCQDTWLHIHINWIFFRSHHWDVTQFWNISTWTIRTRLFCIITRPHSQIPQCKCSIPHNALFRTKNVQILFWMVYCGIWTRCVVHRGICEIDQYWWPDDIRMNGSSSVSERTLKDMVTNSHWRSKKSQQVMNHVYIYWNASLKTEILGIYSLVRRTTYHQTVWSLEPTSLGCYNYHISLKFDRHLGISRCCWGAGQISEWSEKCKPESRDFETSRELELKRLCA